MIFWLVVIPQSESSLVAPGKLSAHIKKRRWLPFLNSVTTFASPLLWYHGIAISPQTGLFVVLKYEKINWLLSIQAFCRCLYQNNILQLVFVCAVNMRRILFYRNRKLKICIRSKSTISHRLTCKQKVIFRPRF